MQITWLFLIPGIFSKSGSNRHRSSESKYINSAGEIYPQDPRKSIFDWETKDTVEENTKWFDKVVENKSIEKFILEMSKIRNGAMMITPANTFGIVDNSPYCAVILGYDSDNQHYYQDVTELGMALVEYFKERCQVGFLDFGYPSNTISFKRFLSKEPILLIRRPYSHQTMFKYNQRELHRTSKLIVLDNKNWGTVVSYDQLVKHPVGSIQLADEEYEKMENGHKISMIYESRINKQNEEKLNRKPGEEEETAPKGREIYEKLFLEITAQLEENVWQKAEEMGIIDALKGDDDVAKFTVKKLLNVKMDNEISSIDFQAELEKSYEKLAKEEKEKYPTNPDVESLLDPVLDPPIELLPISKPNLEFLIPSWISKRDEL